MVAFIQYVKFAKTSITRNTEAHIEMSIPNVML